MSNFIDRLLDPDSKREEGQPRPQLRSLPSAVGWIAIVVLIGYRFANEFAPVALTCADFVVVPMAWMRGLPSHATAKRAARASHLARTHLAAPIELRVADDHYVDIPF